MPSVAIAAASALPLMSAVWPPIDGLLQRSLFLVAYLWYACEALAMTGRDELEEG